ncbi:hypothetical protein, partial [Bradyrhizobium sp. P5_C12]
VLATFMAYALCLRRLSKVMSVPIARVQDWKNLGIILSVSAVCAIVVRLSADVLEPSAPIAATVGPAAVLVSYAAILIVTGYYRTLAEMRREGNALANTSRPVGESASGIWSDHAPTEPLSIVSHGR